MNTIMFSVAGVIGIGLIVATWKAPRLTSILLWSLLAALGSSLAAVSMLPDTLSSRAIWLVLGFPLIWSLLQLWCFWDGRAWRVVVGLFALIAGSVAMLVMN